MHSTEVGGIPARYWRVPLCLAARARRQMFPRIVNRDDYARSALPPQTLARARHLNI